MFNASHNPSIRRELSGQLALKTVATHEDINRVADFNESIHGELRSGELGTVGTDPAYRKRGLIRTLTEHHHAMLADEGYDLSHIQGIPYFYRQFGYEYALPLEMHWNTELHMVPDPAKPLHCRPATEADAPALHRLYDEAMRDLDIYAVRSEAIWRYLLGPALKTGTAADTWVVLDEKGHVQGYWRIERLGFGTGLNVSEASRFDPVTARALIQHLKTLAIARNKPYLRFNLPETSYLVRAAKGFGARLNSRYALQIYLPDPGALIMKMAPILARRLANSPYAELTRSLVLSVFRTAWTLDFEAGQLRSVQPLDTDSWGDYHLPPNLLPQLILGHRTLAELEEIYPDAGSNHEVSDLVAVLFPRTNAFIHNTY